MRPALADAVGQFDSMSDRSARTLGGIQPRGESPGQPGEALALLLTAELSLTRAKNIQALGRLGRKSAMPYLSGSAGSGKDGETDLNPAL